MQRQVLRPAGFREWPDGTITTRYGFQHAIYQYLWQEHVSPGQWQQYHQRIGERKEAGYGQRAEEIAAELAVHFEEGRDYQRAVQYRRLAGENAIRRHATREAIVHLIKGLDFLPKLPDTSARQQQELRLLNALGPLLLGTKGYANQDAERVYLRTQELYQEFNEGPSNIRGLWGLWAYHFMRCHFKEAHVLTEQFVQLAEQQADSALMVKAHEMLGPMLFHEGQFRCAREHLELGSALYNRQQHYELVFVYGQDPQAVLLSYTAMCLWVLGYPDQARERSHQALIGVQEIAHPYSQGFATLLASGFHQLQGEPHKMQEQAETAITLAAEHDFAQVIAQAMGHRGWALAKQGRTEEGLAQLQKSLDSFRATGAELELPHTLGLLAEAQAAGGQTEEGLSTVTEALTILERTGEHYYEAELYRLKGELTLAQSSVQSLGSSVKKSSKFKVQSSKSHNTDPRPLIPDPQAEAEACFLKAIAVARGQEAKSWELRATISLSRLWQRQGKRHEAHQVLSDIYSWFTEGFDTKDLQEAKALLAELSC